MIVRLSALIAAFFISAFISAGGAHAQVVFETIYFVSEDGRSYERYVGSRTGYSSYNIFFDKGQTLDDYLYFFPNAFQWDRESDADNDIIRIRQGDYSYIEQGVFEEGLTLADNGDFVFVSDPGEDPEDDRYGFWNTPANFSQFVYAWVLPKNLEVIEAKANREGEWVRRNNAIAWFGEDMNNVSFELRYRQKTAETYASLRDAVGSADGVSVDQQDGGVRLTLADTVLFASGSADLTDRGEAVVRDVAGAIDFDEAVQAIVEGHTDNVPISGALASDFASNWELSSARALTVVRAMEAAGAPGEQLQARAFGEHRPVADNESAQGRAKNRRISILIESD